MFTTDSLMAHPQHLDGRTAADASRPRVADEQAAAAGPDEHREGGEEGADVEPGVQHPTHASLALVVQRPGRQVGYELTANELLINWGDPNGRSRKCLGSV